MKTAEELNENPFRVTIWGKVWLGCVKRMRVRRRGKELPEPSSSSGKAVGIQEQCLKQSYFLVALE